MFGPPGARDSLQEHGCLRTWTDTRVISCQTSPVSGPVFITAGWIMNGSRIQGCIRKGRDHNQSGFRDDFHQRFQNRQNAACCFRSHNLIQLKENLKTAADAAGLKGIFPVIFV